MKHASIFKFLAVIFLLISALSAKAQDEELDQFGDGIEYIKSSYNTILAEYNKKKIPYDSLKATSKVLITNRDSLFAISTTLNKSLNKLSIGLTALGAVPDEGSPAEPENIAEKRSNINSQVTIVNGYLNETNDLSDKIGKLISEISQYRNSVYLSGITARTVSPFSKDLWTKSWEEFKSLITNSEKYGESFWKVFRGDKKRGNILLILVAVLLAMAVLLFPISSLSKRISAATVIKSQNPKLEKRLKFIISPGLRAIVVFVALSLLYLAANEINLSSEEGDSLTSRIFISTIFSIFLAIALAVFLWYLAKNVFAPDVLLWNRISAAPGRAQGNKWLFLGIMYTYITDVVLTTFLNATGAGMRLMLAESIVLISIFIVFWLLFFSPKRWVFTTKCSNDHSTKLDTKKLNPLEEKAIRDTKNISKEIVFFIGRAIAITILLLICLEYVRMANFVFHRLILLVLFYVVFVSVRTIAYWAILGLTKKIHEPRKTSSNAVDHRTSVDFWLGSALDAVLLVLSVPALLFVLGIDWIDVNNWIHLFFTGFKIGGLTISFKNIFYGLFNFLLIIVVVRWSTSIINKRLTESTDMDSGVRNSLITLMNYVGIVLALFTAVPMMGFDFSNITIVAGALSVGIGFGLQNIVKDFVSGLILLIDRPIKIGDWVVLENGEGYVKEIKSRVTIIQTFDRSNIIVPNSDLVTLPVQNWFYGNKQGRVSLKVGVSFDSDPEQVREVLLQCAAAHPSILASPKPYVLWRDFGESSINFELRGYVANSDNTYLVRSDLHFATYKALKVAGITIPYPQRDLHIVETAESSSKKRTATTVKKPPAKKSVPKKTEAVASPKRTTKKDLLL